MRIRYSVELEDHKAYRSAIRSAFPDSRMIRCLQSIGGPSFLLFCLWLLTPPDYAWWAALAGVLPAAVLGFYLWRQSPGLWTAANPDKLYLQGKLKGHLGEHTLESLPDGLIERNAAGEHFSRWPEIEVIYSTTQHTFFVTKSRLAYILPRRSILEGDYDQFVKNARIHWRPEHG